MSCKALTPGRFVDASVGTKSDYLDESGWFRDFSYEEMKDLAQFFDVYKIPPGEVLGEEGSSESFLGLIVDGSVGIFKTKQTGESSQITSIGPGKVFGEMSLVDGQPRSAEVRVVQQLEVAILTKERFSKFLQVTPALGLKLVLKIARLISMRLRKTSGQLVEHLGAE